MNNPIAFLDLKNFGPHQALHLDFAPGLNLIRAPNRSGKTWILRALGMLLYNEGPAFNKDDTLDEVRYQGPDGKKASSYEITATFADGHRVQRYRDGMVNAYVVTDPTGKETRYEAVGAGFFEPIGSITGIYPLDLDGRNSYHPNLKLPSDPPFFLLGESEQRQDAILTRLVGIDVIGIAEQLTEKESRELSTQLRTSQQQAATLKQSLEPYQNLVEVLDQAEAAKRKFEVADIQSQQAAFAERQWVKLEPAIENYEQARARVQVLLATPDTEPVAAQVANYQQADKAWQSWLSLQSREQVLASQQLMLQGHLPDLIRAIEGLSQQLVTIRKAEANGAALVTARLAVEALDRKAALAKLQAAQLEQAYTDTLQAAGVCPVCGQEIPKGKEGIAHEHTSQ
jgi:DNA repair exonuclease SbcCD ATPase subunit